MSFKRSNFRWKHETTPTQWYIYMNIVLPPKTLTRGETFIFFHPLFPVTVPPVIAARTDTAHRVFIFAFFFSPPFFSFRPLLLLIANLIYCEDWGVQKREIAVHCQIELWAQRTAPATTVAAAAVVKEIATERWLTRVMHRPYCSCLATTPPPHLTVSPFVHKNT